MGSLRFPHSAVVVVARASTAVLHAYLALAIRNQERCDRANGVRPPEGMSEYIAEMLLSVSEGQRGSISAELAERRKAGVTEKKLMTYREAATSLGVSPETIKRRVKDGTFRPVRDGGVVRIPRSQLDDYIDRHQESA